MSEWYCNSLLEKVQQRTRGRANKKGNAAAVNLPEGFCSIKDTKPEV